MNDRSVKASRWLCALLLMALFIFFLIYNSAEKTWTDKMLAEMNAAYQQNQATKLRQDAKNAALADVAYKYFPVGMRREDAFVLLQAMNESGFDIAEYRHEGVRKWPDGGLRPYIHEDVRRHLERLYPPGVSEIVVIKKWQSFIFIEEFFSIGITISDDSGLILRARVNRAATFL